MTHKTELVLYVIFVSVSLTGEFLIKKFCIVFIFVVIFLKNAIFIIFMA